MLRTSAVYIALGLSAALLCAQVAHILGIVPIKQALLDDDDLCGTDHPDIKCLPTRIGIVEMVFEETVHYDLPLNDLSRTEWFALMSPWSHGGFVRLGRDKRAYGVAISHQLHCVVMLGQALANASNPNADIYHVHHCLDYLRQVFLCESDTTLEPGDFELRNYTATPEYNPRTCRDWSAIFGAMEANYKEWEAWYAAEDKQ